MHGPINVKSLNNTNKWQIGFNSAFKGLIFQFSLFLNARTKCGVKFHSPLRVIHIMKFAWYLRSLAVYSSLCATPNHQFVSLFNDAVWPAEIITRIASYCMGRWSWIMKRSVSVTWQFWSISRHYPCIHVESMNRSSQLLFSATRARFRPGAL
jgi:hypothetical protein